MNATKILKQDDLKRLEVAIAQVERRTSAELVCAVSTESGRYDRSESIVGILVAILALGLAHLIHDQQHDGGWAGPALTLGWQVLAVTAGFILGQFLASYSRGLRQLFVSESEMAAEVTHAAWFAFGLASIGPTRSRSGVLIYVSLVERRVLVLADPCAREALGDENISRLRNQAVDFLRAQPLPEACLTIIQAVGATLADKLPANREVHPDELANSVLVFHPRPAVRAGNC